MSAAVEQDFAGLDVWSDPATERLGTLATIITVVRTVASVVLAGLAVREHSEAYLVAALVVYWAGDSLDGYVARVRRCETRLGAVMDILSDRFCAATFYLGLVWLHPGFVIPVFIYLAEFMVVDCVLSLAFLAWPIRSPNYFYVVDRSMWLWNWSKPAKAVNSSLFGVLLLVTDSAWVSAGAATAIVWLAALIAVALLVMKSASLLRLTRIGLPIPTR